MQQFLIGILAFLAVMFIGGAFLLIKIVRRKHLEHRLYGDFQSEQPDYSAHSVRITGALEQVGRKVSSGPLSADLQQRLIHAGFSDPSAGTIYMGAQLLLVFLGLVSGGIIALSLHLKLPIGLCVAFGVMSLLALLPNFYVGYRRSLRRGEVQRNLPDAIDLLEICVSSGMGLDLAWNSVADEFRQVSPVLADEMALVSLEVNLGSPRAQAMRNMSARTGVSDISSLVATLIQSERFGTSVSQALRTYADAMRKERSQRAEEQAEKLAVKLLFPMVLFIFPCMFVVILGPAGIRIVEMFGKG